MPPQQHPSPPPTSPLAHTRHPGIPHPSVNAVTHPSQVVPQQRDPTYGYTHKFAREHEVFANWSRDLPERFVLRQ